jgi:tetraacyldisaccharide 4'-kinase
VLVSAEGWHDGAPRLPAGPMREPAAALARATLVVVTRKSASLDVALALAERLGRRVPDGASAVMHLAPSALVSADGTAAPLSFLAGRRFVAVAAVGAPDAFHAQLHALGAEIVRLSFRDHHRFVADDVRRITALAHGIDGVLCTLKDAVKLAPLWRGADAPLWYVSQAAAVDSGRSRLDASLEAVLTARAHSFQNAGPAGQSFRGHGHRSPTPDR